MLALSGWRQSPQSPTYSYLVGTPMLPGVV